MAILVEIAMNKGGFREVLTLPSDKTNGVRFFQWLCGRGLEGVKFNVGDKCMEMFGDRGSRSVSDEAEGSRQEGRGQLRRNTDLLRLPQ